MFFLSVALLMAVGAFGAGCDGGEHWQAPAIDYVRVDPPEASPWAQSRQALEVAGDPLHLYLNFCREDCTFRPGPDDARQRTSGIVQEEVTLLESVLSDEERDELLRCLYQIFEPFDLLIVDERPVDARYVEAVIAGQATDLGLSPTIAGISPLACGLIEYGINFNFFRQISRVDGIGELCNVIAHETGHTIGLEHAYLCSDVMTYLPHCEDPALFTRADTECGGFFPEACTCGADYQNSHLTVLEELGARQSPIELPPKLRIHSPEPLASVEQGFFVVVEATDAQGVREVELFLNDAPQGSLDEPPFAFATPIDWPVGDVSIRVVATNLVGRTSTATRELTVRERLPEWDAGFLDAAGPRPDGGERWGEADAGFLDPASEDEPRSVEGPGCDCRLSRAAAPMQGSELSILALGLLLFLRRSRRPDSASRPTFFVGLVVAWGLLSSCESEAVRALQPELDATPMAGSVIDFGELLLDEPRPAPAYVRIRNRGDASLLLSNASVSASANGDLSLTGPFETRVDPDGSTQLFVELRPRRPGPIDAELSLTTNDPRYPTLSFPIRGRVRERCRLEPWPTVLDFTLGAEREVSILSASTSPCRVTDLSLDEAIFELVDPPSLPLVLAPNEAMPLVIRHHTRSRELHVPKRSLRIFESESAGAEVGLIGAYPIWNCLAAYPDEQEFPKTAAGMSSELIFTVTNRCTEPAEIESVALAYGAEAFTPGGVPRPLTVPARGSVGLSMAFRPPDGLDYYGRLRINTNDSLNRALYAGMIGRALGPAFASPGHLDLGAVPFPPPSGARCQTPARSFPIFNLGGGSLRVHGLELAGPDADAFTIEDVRLEGASVASWQSGFDVPAYGRAEVRLRFEPLRASPEDHRAELVVLHTPAESAHHIGLAGRAFGQTQSAEYFRVDRPNVDVLFVVDGSRSMSARNQSLASHMQDFVERADSESPANQIALLSARKERPAAGRLIACRFRDAVLPSADRSSTERAEDFNCALALNADDERPQAGLLSAALALGRAAFPSAADPTSFDNERFLRENAQLALVFLSDEDDLAAADVDLFAELYRASKGGRGDLVRIHSIVVPPGGRCPEERYSVPGVRYAEAARLAGGTVQNICEPDVGAALARIVDPIFDPPRGFALAQWPDPSSLEVFVNGVPALADPDLGYTFDDDSNTVVFAQGAAPPRGSSIDVRYRSLCAP